MTKFIYLMAGIVFALGLNANTTQRAIHGRDNWIVFVDDKNQVWSLLESEWQDYRKALQSEVAFSLCRRGAIYACTCFKQPEKGTSLEQPEPEFLYSRKRPRRKAEFSPKKLRWRFS